MIPLAELPAFLDNHLHWWLALVIVIVGLLLAGVGDLSRLSWQRIWAIAGVCFQESIRRRVLWIVPLAIVGVVVIVQLLQPTDEQDAIRQTIKYCLFATGMLVVIATTKLPMHDRGFWAMAHEARTDWCMLLGSLFPMRALLRP